MKKKYLIVILLIMTAQPQLYPREFLNTMLHLNFGGMYSFPAMGNVVDSEKSAVKSQIPNNKNISHYETAYCVTLDLVPLEPIILGMEDHAVKFGIRGSYRFHFLQQSVTTELYEIGDSVMKYRSWMIGPVIHYAPFVEPSDLNEDYTANGGFTLYALYGRIDGDITSYPSLREHKDPSLISNVLPSGVAYGSTGVGGYKIDIGIGAEVALCSLNFGLNFYYTYISFDISRSQYADIGRSAYLKEFCLEMYVGIPIESFIDPLIPSF
jgi:hypothetical protein